MLVPSPLADVIAMNRFAACLLLSLATLPAFAADAVLDPLTTAARAATPAFAAFSPARGEQLFRGKHAGGQAESCTTCHTGDARKPGEHAKTGKAIDPLAPVANTKRFTDPVKVEKWFRRNCKEVLSRECTAQEKGDFVVYMRSVK